MCVIVVVLAAAVVSIGFCPNKTCGTTPYRSSHNVPIFTSPSSYNIAADLQILTEYDELQNVIPNLVVNDVLDLYDGDSSAKEEAGAEHLPEEVRCANLSKTMKGSLLRQVRCSKRA